MAVDEEIEAAGGVSPYDFDDGIGQGDAARDTRAIQLALDAGFHVDMTPRNGQQFHQNGTVYVRTAGQRVYSRIPDGAWRELTAGGPVRLEGRNWADGVAWDVQATKVQISDLSFEENPDNTTGDITVIRGLRTRNTDDLDFKASRMNGHEKGSNWTFFDLHGRGSHIDDIITNTHLPIVIRWPAADVVGESRYHDMPYGHRAMRLTRIRAHSCGRDGAIRLLSSGASDLLRNFVIDELVVDTGRSLVHCDVELVDGAMTNVFAQFVTEGMSFQKPVRATTFSGLHVAGQEDDLRTSPAQAMRFFDDVEDVAIMGCAFSHIDANALQFQSDVRMLTIANNRFKNIGKEGPARCCVALNSAWGVRITGNTARRIHHAFLRPTTPRRVDVLWRDVKCYANAFDAPLFLARPFGDRFINGGRNLLQEAPTLNAQTGNDYRLQTSDAQKVITMGATGGNSVAIPVYAAAAIPVGTSIEVKRLREAGETFIVAEAGVRLNDVRGGACPIDAPLGSVLLYHKSRDEWMIVGAHAEVR